MNKLYSILFQKQQANQKLYDLQTDFDCVCEDITRMEGEEVQSVNSQEWYGEDGEDAYVPAKLRFKAYDWKVKCVTVGSSRTIVTERLESLISYLTGIIGGGCMMKVYSSAIDQGRKDVYFSKCEKGDYWFNDEGMTVYKFTLIFRVTDPRTEVYPDNNANPTKLIG